MILSYYKIDYEMMLEARVRGCGRQRTQTSVCHNAIACLTLRERYLSTKKVWFWSKRFSFPHYTILTTISFSSNSNSEYVRYETTIPRMEIIVWIRRNIFDSSMFLVSGTHCFSVWSGFDVIFPGSKWYILWFARNLSELETDRNHQ